MDKYDKFWDNQMEHWTIGDNFSQHNPYFHRRISLSNSGHMSLKFIMDLVENDYSYSTIHQ